MIFIRLTNGVVLSFDSVSDVKAENSHIIVFVISNENNIYSESKYFFL